MNKLNNTIMKRKEESENYKGIVKIMKEEKYAVLSRRCDPFVFIWYNAEMNAVLVKGYKIECLEELKEKDIQTIYDDLVNNFADEL